MIYHRASDHVLFAAFAMGVLYVPTGHFWSVRMIPYCMMIGCGRLIFRLGVMK